MPGYTEAIGEALGIVPSGAPFDPNAYQAEIISAINTNSGGEVTIRFRKTYGKIDGVNVYSRLQGQADWKLLGFKKLSPYLDETPLAQPGVPEVREYRVRAVHNDVEIGLFRDVTPLTVS